MLRGTLRAFEHLKGCAIAQQGCPARLGGHLAREVGSKRWQSTGAEAERRRPQSGSRRKIGLDLQQAAALSDQRKTLVVIGNGMVSERFCERAVELGLHETRRIIVFGEEPVPAYNRVELTRVL